MKDALFLSIDLFFNTKTTFPIMLFIHPSNDAMLLSRNGLSLRNDALSHHPCSTTL